MNCRKTNKNIITVILTLALVLVCAAGIVSCGKESEETMFPEYTGDLWTLSPSDDTTAEGHIEVDSNDNIIDAGIFTTPVSEENDTSAVDGSVVETVNVTEDGSSSDESVAETTAHVIGEYDGIHNWPSDEFDKNGYKPLNPVTTAVTD